MLLQTAFAAQGVAKPRTAARALSRAATEPANGRCQRSSSKTMWVVWQCPVQAPCQQMLLGVQSGTLRAKPLMQAKQYALRFVILAALPIWLSAGLTAAPGGLLSSLGTALVVLQAV